MTLIDNCDVEKLISAVQRRPPIYDNSAKEHGSRGLLEYLWNEIAEEMNAPVSKCKAKWQQLRNSFVRSYRGTSGYGKKRKKWYLHDALSFMEDHIQLHKIDDLYSSDRISLEDDEIDEKTNHLLPVTLSDSFDESSSPVANTTMTTSPTTIIQPPYTASYFQQKLSTVYSENVRKSQGSPMFLHHDHDSHHHHHHNHQDIQLPPPKLHPIMPQMQAIPSKYLNLAAISNSTTTSSCSEENPLLNFCKGILPEFDLLSAERQRKFKTEILNCLNRHLDEQEKEYDRKIPFDHYCSPSVTTTKKDNDDDDGDDDSKKDRFAAGKQINENDHKIENELQSKFKSE